MFPLIFYFVIESIHNLRFLSRSDLYVRFFFEVVNRVRLSLIVPVRDVVTFRPFIDCWRFRCFLMLRGFGASLALVSITLIFCCNCLTVFGIMYALSSDFFVVRLLFRFRVILIYVSHPLLIDFSCIVSFILVRCSTLSRIRVVALVLGIGFTRHGYSSFRFYLSDLLPRYAQHALPHISSVFLPLNFLPSYLFPAPPYSSN